MKKYLIIFSIIFMLPFLVQGQQVIQNFDSVPDDSYWNVYGNDDPNSTYLHFSTETSEVHEGTGALRIDWQNQDYDQYGGWIGMTRTTPDSLGLLDFSLYTDLVLWYYNVTPQSVRGSVEFRIVLNDADSETLPDQPEQWFTHHYILDDNPGWHKITIKMEKVLQQADAISDDEGFTKGLWAPGSDWGLATGNGELDLDQLVGWTLEFSQNGSLFGQAMDSVKGTILIDEMQLEGIAPVNLVFFNGNSNPANVNMHVGWSGAVEITDEESYDEGTTSLKWAAGASAWDAIYFDLAQPRNMTFNWATDSVQFKIKAPAGIGDLSLVFWDVDHDPDAKEDYAFEASYTLAESSMGYDGTWKQVKIPLRNFNRFAGIWDNDLNASVAGEMDSTEVNGFRIGNMGQVINSDVYFDDVWTGSPEFDWIPPEMVTGVGAAPSDYYNLVYWTNLASETGETYNVYASTSPITDINQSGLEIIASGVEEEITGVAHWLYYPLVDKDVTYYYAVTCSDASGNVGPAGVSTSYTNTGKGVPTISDHAPAGFAADGDLVEWEGVMPWIITPETNVAAGTVTDDADLTATVYLAMDDDNIYVAADVIDDVFEYDSTDVANNWWNEDAFEFYIGLWDQNGKPIHDKGPSASRGAEPDYKLIFLQDRYYNEYKNTFLGVGGQAEYRPGTENYYFEEYGGKDYTIEARIPLDAIAFDTDALFHPERGMRLMFDLVFHDADGSGWEGNMTWSPNNTDLAYLDQHEWTFTWIGDTTHTVTTGLEDEIDAGIPGNFNLSQNYPNPFNPTTTIDYEVAKNSVVKIELYDLLGQKIRELVNQRQAPGKYQVKLDASDLSTGVYFYKMQAGNFVQTHKMLLMK
jgi:hypothetical protein